MLACRGPGTVAAVATTTVAAKAELGTPSAEADTVLLPVSAPVDAPPAAVANAIGSPTYEIEYIDNYDADEMVHKVEVV